MLLSLACDLVAEVVVTLDGLRARDLLAALSGQAVRSIPQTAAQPSGLRPPWPYRSSPRGTIGSGFQFSTSVLINLQASASTRTVSQTAMPRNLHNHEMLANANPSSQFFCEANKRLLCLGQPGLYRNKIVLPMQHHRRPFWTRLGWTFR